MDLSEVKGILEALQRACTEAENDGERDIVSVLSKPEFINSLRQLWAHIPLKTRRSIGRRPNKGVRSSQKRLKAENKSRITLPHAFTAKLSLWEENPLLFFNEDKGISLDLEGDPFAGSYKYLSRLEKRTETDTVRLRLMKVTYHRLKERLCLNCLRTDDVDTVVQIISKSGTTKDLPGLIRHRVSRWTDEGKRIDTLCRDINRAKSLDDSHLGTLFCLPQDIPDELIRALPLNGPDREEEIRLLKDRGISKVASEERLGNLAKTIFKRLWEKIESAILRLQISEQGSNWKLQHTQYFRIQDTGVSSPDTEEGADTATISSSSGRMSPEFGSEAVISPGHSPPGSETTTENDGATYQDPAPLSSQINADSVQPTSGLQGPEAMVGVDNTSSLFENFDPSQTSHRLQSSHPMAGADGTFNLFENVEPLRTVHGLQSSHPMAGADSTFNLFENVEPLPTVQGLQSSYPMIGADSTFNLFENIEPLQTAHRLQSSFPTAGVDSSTFNLFENGQPPQTPHGLRGSFNLYENIQPLRQPFSGSFHDDHIVAERSPSNWPQSTSFQQLPLPVSVP